MGSDCEVCNQTIRLTGFAPSARSGAFCRAIVRGDQACTTLWQGSVLRGEIGLDLRIPGVVTRSMETCLGPIV
jgi:hypothetical protein